MCGRYTLRRTAEEVAEAFNATPLDDLVWSGPRYNLAPTQNGLFVRQKQEDTDRNPQGLQRELTHGRWALVPHWVDVPDDWPTLINARSETAHKKPAFRGAFRKLRCLIPADGFFEWQPQDGGPKRPHHIHFTDDRLFAFAGLWEEHGERGSEEYFRSYTILTTDASDALAPIHDRQPVLLPPGAHDRWLDPETELRELNPLFEPVDPGDLEARPISRTVNSPENDSPAILEEASPGG